jgi:hypothetical protein
MKKLMTQARVGTSHNEILALQVGAKEMGWEVYPVPSGWRLDDELIKSGTQGVPYGSQTFGEVIAQQMNWELKANSFDWLARVPKQYVKRQIDFMPLKDAKLLTVPKFIKPADDKCFDAKVYEPGEFKPHESIPDDYPTLVSDIVQWDLEYRCFVGQYQDAMMCFTWSNYLFYGDINDPKFHRMVPADLPLPDHFVSDLLWSCVAHNVETVPSVIDIGVIPGKGWAVIESNQAWASGLYGCDPMQALKVMEQSVERLPQNPVQTVSD